MIEPHVIGQLVATAGWSQLAQLPGSWLIGGRVLDMERALAPFPPLFQRISKIVLIAPLVLLVPQGVFIALFAEQALDSTFGCLVVGHAGLFWAARLLAQLWYFSHWPRSTWALAGHYSLCSLFLFQSASYLLGAIFGLCDL